MKQLKYLALLAIASLMASCGTSKYATHAEYPTPDSSIKYEGILEACMHDCSVEGPHQRRMYVYLPADYHDTTERYPVLYLLHGARGNELSWIEKGDLLHNIDSLTANGKMKETIVVLPNMNQYNNEKDYGKSRLKGAMEAFYETDGMVEYAFVNDVVYTVDSLYRTIADKEHRAIAGLSIGAMQSMHISANAPDMFGYVGMFSSMVHPVLRHSEHSSFYKGFKRKLATQFATPPLLYSLMIGRRDFYYPRMLMYSGYLDRKGYPHQLHLANRGHDWPNWEEFANHFMQQLWHAPATMENHTCDTNNTNQ